MLHPRLVFLILLCVIGVLWRIIGYWRRKTGEAAFAAARSADTAGKRDYYSRLAVMAGHREACRMFGFAHPDIFEDKQPLRVFMLHGVRVVFTGIIIRHDTGIYSMTDNVLSATRFTASKKARHMASHFSRLA